jgi:ABC-type phosphate/phosphonate transport system substrate-binding protein
MSERIASLGMYDRPELQPANDRLWEAIAGHLQKAGVIGVPDRLDRSRPLDAIWDDPALLLAQCCGYPMTTRYDGRLRYLSTPIYRATGCDGPRHRSRLIARHDDERDALSAFRGARAALNGWDSNTGMNLLRVAVARLAPGPGFFAEVIETGSHAESARRIADGEADVAAVDTVTYAHLERYEPDVTARLRTIGWTDLTPGLPLVTSAATSQADQAALMRAIRAAVRDPALAGACDLLLLDDVRPIGSGRYAPIRAAEHEAIRSGYPVLA